MDNRWTGKAWGLTGLQSSTVRSQVDLDTCCRRGCPGPPKLARSLLAPRSKKRRDDILRRDRPALSGNLEALIHPAMLTTLIYRFGSPGSAQVTATKFKPTANVFLPLVDLARNRSISRRASLAVRRHHHRAPPRRMRRAVGFYETNGLVDVKMYNSWRETWNNWPRSCPCAISTSAGARRSALFGVLIVQALPLPAFLVNYFARAISITVADLCGCRILHDDHWASSSALPVLIRPTLVLLAFAARRSARRICASFSSLCGAVIAGAAGPTAAAKAERSSRCDNPK